MTEYELIDNQRMSRYEFHIDGFVAFIEYSRTRDGVIYLRRTVVPLELEGQGIGSRLIASILADIDRKGWTMLPQCPFVINYLRKHPDWARIMEPGVFIH